MILQASSSDDSEADARLDRLVSIRRRGVRESVRCMHPKCAPRNRWVQRIDRHYRDVHPDDKEEQYQGDTKKYKMLVKKAAFKVAFRTLYKKRRFYKEMKCFLEMHRMAVCEGGSDSEAESDSQAHEPQEARRVTHSRLC